MKKLKEFLSFQKNVLYTILLIACLLTITTIISSESVLDFPIAMWFTIPSTIALLIATPFILNKLDK